MEQPEEVADEYYSSEEEVGDGEELVLEETSYRPAGALPPVPRTGHVDPKVRRDIRSGKLVNLRKLLRLTQNDNNDTNNKEKDGNNLRKLPYGMWHDAFLVYFSIRVEAYPQETQGLIRHMQIVRQLNQQGKDGVEYDNQFRECRVSHPSIQWGEYLAEIIEDLPQRNFTPWQRRPAFGTQTHFQHQQAVRARGRGVMANNYNQTNPCYAFNSITGCARYPCMYKHVCMNCTSRTHGKGQCSHRRPPYSHKAVTFR